TAATLVLSWAWTTGATMASAARAAQVERKARRIDIESSPEGKVRPYVPRREVEQRREGAALRLAQCSRGNATTGDAALAKAMLRFRARSRARANGCAGETFQLARSKAPDAPGAPCSRLVRGTPASRYSIWSERIRRLRRMK